MGKSSVESSIVEGQTLIGGRYQVVRKLGVGRTGIVYEVADQQLDGERIALKLLYPHLLQESGNRQRFGDEVFFIRQLNHPNIVRLYEIELDNREHQYITMELVSGFSLRHIMDNLGRKFSEEEVRSIISQLLFALKLAHQKGIVHRDIKPENILIETSGILKLGDFGCLQSSENVRLTQTGQLIGTPAYMAPEQFIDGEICPATDLYSAGVIAYELLAETLPFGDNALYELARSHTEVEPNLDRLGKKYSPILREYVSRSLEKSHSKRISDADQALRIFDVRDAGKEAKVLEQLITEHFLNIRGGSAVRKRLVTFHICLFVLVLVPVLTIYLAQGVRDRIYADLIRVENYLGIDGDVYRKLFAIPDISLGDLDSINDAVAAEDLRRVLIWCEAGVVAASSKSQLSKLIRSFIENPRMLSYVLETDFGCLPIDLFDRADEKGEFPVIHAVRFGNVMSLRLLVQANFNSNVEDRNGISALALAIRSGNPLLVKALLPENLNRLVLRDSLATASFFEAIALGDVDMVEALLELGVGVTQRDSHGLSAMMYLAKAPESTRLDIARMLMDAGASCSARDDNGNKVVDYFASLHNSQLGLLLSSCQKSK